MNTSISIQNFWNEFIDLYRDLPALWKKHSDEYKTKQIKQRSYVILTNKLREILPDATVATTKKKINSLRSNYRKEVRKIEDSINMGAGEDQLYTPRSWYFKKMNFLAEENMDNKNLKQENEECDDGSVVVMGEQYEYFETVDDEENTSSKPIREDLNKPVVKRKIERGDPLIRTPSPPLSMASNHQKVHLKIERIESITGHTGNQSPVEPEQVSCSQSLPAKRMCVDQNDSDLEDECEILTRAWICEYKKLDEEQQLFANKAISDILFEGRLKKLNYHSVKVNQKCGCKCTKIYDDIDN